MSKKFRRGCSLHPVVALRWYPFLAFTAKVQIIDSKELDLSASLAAPWRIGVQKRLGGYCIERQMWNGGGFEAQYHGSHAYHLDRSFYNDALLLPGPGAEK